MRAKIRLAGHSVHQMLIVFPLGLLATAVVFDIIHFITADPIFLVVSFWLIAAGIIGGIIAAPFGTLDWLNIPKHTRAKTIGIVHAISNVVVLGCFIVSWLIRYPNAIDFPAVAYVFSFVGAGIAVVGGWLGGELVSRLGVGVDEGAHLDAPSSLNHPTVESEIPKGPRKVA